MAIYCTLYSASDSDNASWWKRGVGDNYNEKALSLVFSQHFLIVNVYNIRLNFLKNVILSKVLIFSTVTEIFGMGSRVCAYV